MLAVIVLIFCLGVIAQNKSPLILEGTLYDFADKNSGLPQAHPDFNSFLCGLQKGMVSEDLGPDKKPVLIDTKNCITSEETFNQWFRPTEGVNLVSSYTLVAQYDPVKMAYTYSNSNFFPLDDQGYGNEQYYHNYGFCFELHSQFTYSPEQVFQFMGDDDVWVFINNKLVIDLGGVHGSEWASVSLNTLDLVEDAYYDLDFFFCERHITGSNLILSTFDLSPCGIRDTDDDGTPDLCDICPGGDLSFTITVPENPTLTVPITVTTTGRTTEDVSFTITFGDNDELSQALSNTLQYVHTYATTGTYTITVSTEATSGCGAVSESKIIRIIGDKKAPVCSRYMGLVLGRK
jgi:fibro-slime domain-containing protein